MLLRIFQILSIIAAAGLLICAWLPLVNPAHFWPAGFAGLLFPMVWVINAILVLCWLPFRRRRWLIPFLAIILSLPAAHVYCGFGGIGKDITPSSRSFSIMTFNTSSMGLHDYKPDTPIARCIDSIFQIASPDILCLQEFYTNDRYELGAYLDTVRKNGNYPGTFSLFIIPGIPPGMTEQPSFHVSRF